MERTSSPAVELWRFVFVNCAPVANPKNFDANFRISMPHDQFICLATHVRGDVHATLPAIIDDFKDICQKIPSIMILEYLALLVGSLHPADRTDALHSCRMQCATAPADRGRGASKRGRFLMRYRVHYASVAAISRSRRSSVL